MSNTSHLVLMADAGLRLWLEPIMVSFVVHVRSCLHIHLPSPS